METRFSILQNSITERVSSLPPIKSPPNKDSNFLSKLTVPVTSAARGDWKQSVSLRIKQIGIGIVVKKGNYSLNPPIETYPFFVEIVEIPALNRGALGSNLTSEAASETVIEGIRNWSPAEWVGHCEDLRVDSKEGTNNLSYLISFKVRAYVNERTREL